MNISTLAPSPVSPSPALAPVAPLETATAAAVPLDSAAISGGFVAAPGSAPVAANASNPWPELERLGLVSATTTVSGPIGQALTASARQGLCDALHRLEANGVTFERQRGVRLPGLMDKYIRLSADELADALENEPAEFKTQFNVNVDKAEHVHLQNLTDLRLLDGWAGLGSSALPTRASVIDAAHDAEKGGWTFSARNYAGAYDSNEPAVDSAFAALMALVHRGEASMRQGNGSADWAPLTTDSDVIGASYFDGNGPDRGLSDGALAAAIREAASKGFTLSTSEYIRNPSAARDVYTALAQGKSVKIGHDTQWGIDVTAAEMKNLSLADARMKQATDIYERFAKPTLSGTDRTSDAPFFVDFVLNDKHSHAPDLKGMVLSECLTAERRGNDWNALSNANEDMGHLLDMSGDPARVLAFTAQFSAALQVNRRDEVWNAMTHARDEMKARAGSDTALAQVEALLVRLLEKTRSFPAALEGVDLVRIPMGSETEEDRVRLFLDIAGREPEGGGGAHAADDYRAVMVHRLPTETLLEAGQRMLALFDTLALSKQQGRAAEAFCAIQEGTREGRFGSRSADETVQKLAEAMVTSRSLDDAMASLGSHGGAVPAGPSTVETGDDYVVIGGIRVPRSGQR